MPPEPPFMVHRCRAPGCVYSTLPSREPSPYARCPLCGGPWVAERYQPKALMRVVEVFASGSAHAVVESIEHTRLWK